MPAVLSAAETAKKTVADPLAGGIYSTGLNGDSAGTSSLNKLSASLQNEYTKTYQPIQHSIAAIAAGANGGQVMADVNQEGQLAGSAIDSAEAGFRRGLRNQGGIGESAAAVQQFGLRRVLAQVDAMNRTAQSARQRQESAQEYGLQQTTRNAATQSTVLGEIAKGEADRYAQYQQAKAAAKAASNALTGKLIGMGASAAMMM